MTEPNSDRPVVVGADGSDQSVRAVRWAARDAAAHGVGLRILHAIGVPDYFPGSAISPSTELYHVLEREANKLLKYAAGVAVEAVPGLAIETDLTTDPPAVALIEASSTARTLVLGESGRGAFAGLLLGSTTVTLAAHAHCPVVAVRGDDARGGSIVVGVDGSDLSDQALGCAFEQASSRHVPLVAVHAVSDAEAHDEPPPAAEQQVLDERLSEWAPRFPDVTVERDVVVGKPRQRLMYWSERAGLVVVGCRGRGGFAGLLLGSTSQALLHHSGCPVMVARPEAAAS